MKIINIRGSHGSGKSWVVRQVMASLAEREVVMRSDNKKVEGYAFAEPPLFCVGKIH